MGSPALAVADRAAGPREAAAAGRGVGCAAAGAADREPDWGGNRNSSPIGQRRESQAESVARQAHSTIHGPAPFIMLPVRVRGFIGVLKSTAASGTIVTSPRRLTTLRLLCTFPPDYGNTPAAMRPAGAGSVRHNAADANSRPSPPSSLKTPCVLFAPAKYDRAFAAVQGHKDTPVAEPQNSHMQIDSLS